MSRIAVVGLGGLFPGAATPSQLWRNVVGRVDAAREPPPGRWVFAPQVGEAQPDCVNSRRACFLDPFDVETSGLDIEPGLLARLDPVFRLALEASRRAWESAVTGTLDRRRVGVILGAIALPTEKTSALTRHVLGQAFGFSDEMPHPLNVHPTGLPARLVAKSLGLGGCAFTLDAACASSLYAVKLAMDELTAGRADAMLAGGVSRPDSLFTQMGFSQLRALSPSGRCSPFDARGDGLIVGEGAGVFVLKRLEDAQRDGDRVYGVIAGVGLSNDIEGGLLAPASEGQLRAMRAAYAMAGWRPDEVDLIECHATGTPVGDKVEFESLKTLWEDYSGEPGRCVLGAVKSSVGHLLTAAGAAALTKVLLAMQEETLPPTTNFETPAPGLGMERSPFRVLREAEAWPRRSDRPRRAAVSGFGFGGINAHLLIESGVASAPPLLPNATPLPSFVSVVAAEASLGSRPVGLSTNRFRIPPREAEDMLPQQALMLDVAARALDRAELTDAERQRTGVFVGVGLDLNTTNFHLRWAALHSDPARADEAGPPLTAYRTMGALASIAASRIARAFRLGGPSFTVSSLEESGLTALRLAAEALRKGEIDAALVGAVDLPSDKRTTVARGDGTPACDAAVALVLRRGMAGVAEADPTDAPTSFDLAGREVYAGAASGLAAFYLSQCVVRREGLFAVEGENPGELLRRLDDLSAWVASRPEHDIELLTRAWLHDHWRPTWRGRAVALLPRGRDELVSLIEQARDHLRRRPNEPSRDRVSYSPAPLGPSPVALVYPGSGNDFPGMGRDVARAWPELLREQSRENRDLEGQYLPHLFWRTPSEAPTVRDRLFAQVALGTLVTDLLVGPLKLRPDAAIGYSLGESSMLFGLRAWRGRDEMLTRMHASTLFTSDLTGRCDAARAAWGTDRIDWRTAIVARPAAAVRAALRGLDRAYLQIVNTPTECVVGGERDQVEELARRLGCAPLPVPETTTMHCPVVRPVAEAYRALHRLPTTPPAGVRFYSAALGHAFEVDSDSAAEAILAQALDTIDFPAVVEAAYRDGVRVFVEAGPGASCSRMIGAILGDRPHLARSVCVPGSDGLAAVWRLAAQMVAERVPVSVEGLYGFQAARSAGEGRKQPSPALRAGSAGEGTQQPARALRVAPELELTVAVNAARVEAQEAFLRYDESLRRTFTDTLTLQGQLIDLILQGATPAAAPSVALDRRQCLEYAIGKVANVLGADFAEADAFPTRVRLPDEPLMLVDRILTIEGEARSLTHGRVVTEHDVLPGAWYLDNGRIPTCLAVESGQADLFLSGYLGIDLRTRGLAVYRLLDAVVTFHRGLPTAGETIRYDIHIDRFFRQGETHLFRFRFVGSVNGEPLLTMTEGIAGFFSEQELAAGKGVVRTTLQLKPRPGVEPDDAAILPSLAEESYTEPQLDALRRGDLAACFGPTFANLPLGQPAGLPGGRMRLVHRVTKLEPRGGRFGIGRITAEADIHPDDWFLTCHFVDDQVMPGTLMYECCLHTLRIFLLRLGWVGEEAEVVCEPVPGVGSRLKCRGQVTAATRTVTYEVELKERGYRPEPYVICDALMYADGKAIVEITDMTLRMSGLTREKVADVWSRGRLPGGTERSALYDRHHILAFATGKPSEAFGDRYLPFDTRFIARLPGPPYCFLDRVVKLNAEAWKMVAGGKVEAEYDVPPNEWYFAAERAPIMPFAVLLEIPLQVCGWMSAYMGSALTSEQPLHYRNLGGVAELTRVVTPDSGTLTSSIRCTRVAASGGMIIQDFAMQVRDARGVFYQGTTTFGFFSKEALSQQIGVRDAKLLPASSGRSFDYPRAAPYPDAMLGMLDRVEHFDPDGGPAGLGLIEGVKTVRPEEWFFQAHFYQDPVMPGSLGLEALLQMLKVVAAERWGGGSGFAANVGKHRWTYRGQVIPTNKQVRVQAVITAIDDEERRLVADGYLSVDGLVIYQMNDFSLRLR